MGIPKLLRKVFLLDLLQGLKVTFRYQDPREIYTEQYPLQRPQVAERYRGAPRLNVNPDTNETMCIACDLCALACPVDNCITMEEIATGKPTMNWNQYQEGLKSGQVKAFEPKKAVKV